MSHSKTSSSGVILKLRPGGRSSSINYHALQGHFVVIPRDKGPLLDVLLSPEIRLHNLIGVFCVGQKCPLHRTWANVAINRAVIDDWSDDFIPTELRDSIVSLYGSDHHEREGYTVHLQSGNFKNNLQAAQDNASLIPKVVAPS